MSSGESQDSLFEILNKDDDYITSHFRKLYPVLKESFSESTDEITVLRVLRIGFGPCLNLFTIDTLEEEFFKYSCPAARQLFIQTLEGIEGYGSSTQSTQTNIEEIFTNLIYVCQEIISYLIQGFQFLNEVLSINIHKIKSLLIYSCEILFESYQHCSKIEECYGSHFHSLKECLMAFFKKSQEMQVHLIQVLSKIDTVNEQAGYCILNDALTFLFKSGIILLNLDVVKTMADLWKQYVNLTAKYSEQMKGLHNVSLPVQYLSQNIVSSIEDFVRKSDVDQQNLIKMSKILCFVLKLIIKITETFYGYLKECQDSLINLLLSLNCIKDGECSETWKEETTVLLKQLVVGFDPLLNILINDCDFAEEIFSTSKMIQKDSQKGYSLLLLCNAITKKLMFADSKVRKIWFDSSDNILNCIFQNLDKCRCELNINSVAQPVSLPNRDKKIDVYECLLITVSAFLITSTAKEFFITEKTLIQYIFHSNPWCSLFASDIWCILARFGDADLCYSQLNNLCKLWIEIQDSPPPQKLNLESLIRRLFPLMSQKHRDSFHKIYPGEKYPELWVIFGVDYLQPELEKSVKSTLFQAAVKRTNSFLNDPAFSAKNYLEMESALIGSSIKPYFDCEEYWIVLMKLWKFDPNKLITNPLHKRFIRVAFAVTATKIQHIDSRNMQLVLQQIRTLLPHLNPSSCLQSLEIVRALEKVAIPVGSSQNEVFRLISSLFYEYLTHRNPFLRVRSMEAFASFASVTNHTDIISRSVNNDGELQSRLTNYLQNQHPKSDKNVCVYLKSLTEVKYEHSCKKETKKFPMDDVICEPSPKKIKLDVKNGEYSDLNRTISFLKGEVIKLNRLTEVLTPVHKRELQFVSDALIRLLRD